MNNIYVRKEVTKEQLPWSQNGDYAVVYQDNAYKIVRSDGTEWVDVDDFQYDFRTALVEVGAAKLHPRKNALQMNRLGYTPDGDQARIRRLGRVE